jgi:tetratricopeptide (TPR) repeat protein
VQHWVHFPSGHGEPFEELRLQLEEIAQRAKNVGCLFSVADELIQVPELEILAKKTESSSNESLRDRIAGHHASEMAQAYLQGDQDRVRFHRELATRFGSAKRGDALINVAYLATVEQKYHDAEKVLRDLTDEPEARSLAHYNLAMAQIGLGQIDSAVDSLKTCLSKLDSGALPEHCICLLVPETENGILRIVERRGDLALQGIATEALAVVESYQKSVGGPIN